MLCDATYLEAVSSSSQFCTLPQFIRKELMIRFFPSGGSAGDQQYGQNSLVFRRQTSLRHIFRQNDAKDVDMVQLERIAESKAVSTQAQIHTRTGTCKLELS